MYVRLHSRIHDLATPDNRDQLNSQRHVQAVVTIKLCYHACQLPQKATDGKLCACRVRPPPRPPPRPPETCAAPLLPHAPRSAHTLLPSAPNHPLPLPLPQAAERMSPLPTAAQRLPLVRRHAWTARMGSYAHAFWQRCYRPTARPCLQYAELTVSFTLEFRVTPGCGDSRGHPVSQSA